MIAKGACNDKELLDLFKLLSSTDPESSSTEQMHKSFLCQGIRFSLNIDTLKISAWY